MVLDETVALPEIGDEDQAVDLASFIEALTTHPIPTDGPPTPAVAGTFALYPGQQGGVVIVMDVTEGPDGLKGKAHRAPISRGMIRMLTGLAGGGSKLGGMLGRRR